MPDADVIVIGGGILGLGVAHRLIERHPSRRVIVLEKETALAMHQTGRNSGVIHSGIYYTPGSLKAINCRRGKTLLEAFCTRHGVRFETCGKVIVAVDQRELGALERIADRGQRNGVRCERIGRARLRELEPHAHGLAALHVPETGIVDYPGVCAAMARLIVAGGGRVLTATPGLGARRVGDAWCVRTPAGEFSAGLLVNCAGLQSDRVTSMTGGRSPVRIVPFRGEYFALRPAARGLCRNLIYPVPDPSFPFLGVHFTRMVLGGVECGPNAVLALAREGYRWRDVSVRDVAEMAINPSLWRLLGRHWRTAAGEVRRSLSRSAFTAALRRLIPEVREEDLEPIPAGVRAQALGPGGRLLDDFAIEERAGVVNVCNAPSPAATACLSIADTIVDRLERQGVARGRRV